MEKDLGAVSLRQEWGDGEWARYDDYRMEHWKLDQPQPRYFAVVMQREPRVGPAERKLVGCFELTPTTK